MGSALEIRGIKYVVSGDNKSVDTANERTAAGMQRLGRQAEQTKIQFLAFGKQGEVSARQLQALGYQTTDIITQLASGQATWLVLLQQGGQLRDQFGGFANVFKAVAGVLTLGRVAALGATGAFVGLAAGLTLGYTESAEFRKQMALSGNAAGITAGRVDELSARLATLTGNTRGNARDAIVQLAHGGFTAAGALDSASRAALSLQRVSGESMEDITKRFATARDSVVRWATENNRSYNYITAAQVEYIRALEQQGRTQEALRVNFDALSQTMESRHAAALGTIERGWQLVKNAAAGAWDAIKAVGRDDTLEQQLEKVRKRIADAEKSGNQYGKLGLAKDYEREFSLAKQLQRQLEQAGNAAQIARDEQTKIEEASKAHQDALLRIAEAGSAKYLAQQQSAIEARARQQQQAFERFESSPQQYREQLVATERARLAAEQAQIEARRAVEQQRKVEGSPAEIKQQEIARTVALIGLDTQLVNLAAKRAKVEADVRNFRAAVPGERSTLYDPAAEFRNLERAGQAQLDGAFNAGPSRARDVAREWQHTNAEISASLIQDEQARGQALLALEVQQLRQRKQIGLTTAEEFKALEDGLADYTIARERELTEQLKPEWQRRLELYRDSVRFQRESFNDFMNATTQGGESAWRDFLLEGRDFAKALKRTIEQELVTIGWRKFLAEPFAKMMQLIANSLGLGGGGWLSAVGGAGAAGGPVDAPFWSAHTGGIAGIAGGSMRRVNPLVFAGARRYHGGGLAGGEIPAILLRGERVLNRADTQRYDHGGPGPVQFGPFHFNVPAGSNPSAYAAALEPRLQQLRNELLSEMARPGTPAHNAARR